MTDQKAVVPVEGVEQAILLLRGRRVMLDADLARIYGVETKALNQAVKRNAAKFPADFIFQLTMAEADTVDRLRSQIVTLKRGQHRKYLPYAFTEHGAIMVATVLNSPRAVQMSVFVVRAFVQMRATLSANRALARQLAALEQALKDRLDTHDAAVITHLQHVLDILNPPRKEIGFHVK